MRMVFSYVMVFIIQYHNNNTDWESSPSVNMPVGACAHVIHHFTHIRKRNLFIHFLVGFYFSQATINAAEVTESKNVSSSICYVLNEIRKTRIA